MKNEKKNTEFEHFSALANDWWSKNGKFKILHDIQPIRIKYILEALAASLYSQLEKTESFRFFFKVSQTIKKNSKRLINKTHIIETNDLIIYIVDNNHSYHSLFCIPSPFTSS